MTQSLSVVVPLHNEEQSVEYFYGRAKPVLESLGLNWKILFVNDASTDSSLEKILALRKTDGRVGVVTLSRNFGYHPALVAGLEHCDSEFYALIDVDCEDPPELLSTFYLEVKKGAHTVYGIRSQRDEPSWVTFCRRLFYLINRRIADAPVRLWMAEFVMIRRTVRDAILNNKTTFPFLRSEMSNVGLRMSGVPYFRERRKYGVSHYNFFRMAKFAVAGFLASSTFPLRAILHLSFVLGAGYAGLVAILRPSLAAASQLAMIGSFAFLVLTIPFLALYLARTYKNGAARPVYYVDPDATFLP